MKTTPITYYAIENAEGLKYEFDRGFTANLPWHKGDADKDGWLTEVLNGIKESDPTGEYKIVEHYHYKG
jgi:hypothetical protein